MGPDRGVSGCAGRLLAAGAALAGYALTMLFRSTVATLGVLFAVAVGRHASSSACSLDEANERWMLHTNVAAFVQTAPTTTTARRVTCVPTTATAIDVQRHEPPAPGVRGGVPRPSCWPSARRCPGRSFQPPRRALTPRASDTLGRRVQLGSRDRRAPTRPAPAPEGRKLLRLEVRNAETPIERKPEWIKTRAKMGPEYTALQSLVKSEGLHTVCQEAGCPNIFECWEDREATFLIGGDQCTRRCDFCQIDTGKPQPLDRDEPRRVAESVQKMELRYATITGVARDDLPDGGAWLYAETVRAIHELNPGTGVENLIPDFNGKPDLLARGLRVAARGARPQRRDGAADLQADPPGVPLRPLARRAHPGPRRSAWSPSPT